MISDLRLHDAQVTFCKDFWPFVIHRWSVDSPHKGPVLQKALPCHGVILKDKTIVTVVVTRQSLSSIILNYDYRKSSNIRRTFVGNKIVDQSDVVGASPVGAAPTTSSFST